LLNRPVGFFCYDLEEYQKNDRELVCSYESTTPGFKAYNFQELLLNLEVFLSSGTDKYEEERQRVRRIFYDDYACKSVSPYLEEFVISGKLKKQYYGR
jgi:CDP-glycerol glycerophosphotransferase (TagB/SpsB family)